jgi:GTP cyclohydrolase IA
MFMKSDPETRLPRLSLPDYRIDVLGELLGEDGRQMRTQCPEANREEVKELALQDGDMPALSRLLSARFGGQYLDYITERAIADCAEGLLKAVGRPTVVTVTHQESSVSIDLPGRDNDWKTQADNQLSLLLADVSNNPKNIEQCVAQMIGMFPGEDPTREGLLETPKRVAKAFLGDFLKGYQEDPKDILKTFSGEDYDEMVLVKNIPFYSLCEHHMVPFFGTAHVGYIPSGRIVGLSKLPRLVDCFSRRLQVQERLTREIATALDDHLSPTGVMVVVNARHMCMEARGIRKAGSSTTTSCVMGAFKDTKKGAREEFLRLIREP